MNCRFQKAFESFSVSSVHCESFTSSGRAVGPKYGPSDDCTARYINAGDPRRQADTCALWSVTVAEGYIVSIYFYTCDNILKIKLTVKKNHKVPKNIKKIYMKYFYVNLEILIITTC